MQTVKNIFIRIRKRLYAIITGLAEKRRGGVYYINGPEVLPAPLSREEEARAISRLEEDENARQLLIEHNLRLVVYIAKRFENTGESNFKQLSLF